MIRWIRIHADPGECLANQSHHRRKQHRLHLAAHPGCQVITKKETPDELPSRSFTQ